MDDVTDVPVVGLQNQVKIEKLYLLKMDIIKELRKDAHSDSSTLLGKRKNIILPNVQKVHGIEDILVG